MTDKKKIPESYEKNAPRFDDEKPEELLQFLDHVERMMALEETDDGDKNAFVVRYALRKPAEEWKRFESYKETYEKFKKEILENYPGATDTTRGSMRVLRKLLKGFDDEDISVSDVDELMKLSRTMNVEAVKLLDSGLISHREAIPLFLDKLDSRFQEKILDNLDRAADRGPAAAPVAGGANVQLAGDGLTYTLKSVIDEAKRLAIKRDNNLDFFQKSKGFGSTSGRSLSPRTVKTETNAQESQQMLESIKMTVVNMMDRLEAQTNQRLTDMDSSQKKKMAELDQFYKSLPGKLPGAADSQSLPPRPQVRFRPLTQNDLCHYCQDAGGHWISNCPHRAAHIASGALKVINGKDCYPSSIPVPRFGTKSVRQLIDEYQSKGNGTSQVNVQTAFVQQNPGLYQLEPEERMAIATDNGDGYGYFDPSEYDPRDDEIRTLRVEQANMMRQLVQHQFHQSQRGVQPPPAVQPSIQPQVLDINMVSALLAATLNKTGYQTPPPTEVQLVQTRGNPSRTGNSQSNEGF
jgi:hypothetical protein